MTIVRESHIEDVKSSTHPPVMSGALKKLEFVPDESKCYRVVLQFGPNVSWNGMSGLGPHAGWKQEEDPSNKENLILHPKYVMKEAVMDGATVNGRIQDHNDFIDGLAKNARTANNNPIVTLDQMLAVIKVEEVAGALASRNIFFGHVDKDLLRAFIRQEAMSVYNELSNKELADLAKKK